MGVGQIRDLKSYENRFAIINVRQTVDLIKEKKMGVERIVDLNKKIMGERNRRLVS